MNRVINNNNNNNCLWYLKRISILLNNLQNKNKYRVYNKMKIKTYYTVGTIQKSNIKIVKRGKIDTSYTHM